MTDQKRLLLEKDMRIADLYHQLKALSLHNYELEQELARIKNGKVEVNEQA